MKIRISFVILWWLLPLALLAQNRVSHQQFIINYESVPVNSNLHSVLSLLSVNNEKNIRSLQVEMKWRRFVELQSNGVKLSTDNLSLAGDVYFRDFNFDTLITPDRVKLTFSWTGQQTGIWHQQQYITVFPYVNRFFKLSNYYGEPVTVSAEFQMSDKKYSEFVKAAGIANHYYGFRSVLLQFKKRSHEKDGAGLLLDYIETHRAVSRIKELDIISFLNLRQHDPEKFLPLYHKTIRLETRKRTLANQFLNKYGQNQNLKADFAGGLVGLSVRYLTEKTRFQPYIAASYEKMALLSADDQTFDYYRFVCNRLDKFDNQSLSASQRVFNEFVKQAGIYEASESYSYSLLMLDNAHVWAEKMNNVVKEPAFGNRLQQTIDGMLSSYLKVASAGMRSGNRKMAERYLSKASDLYQESVKKYPRLSNGVLPRFRQTLFHIANDEIDTEHFQNALDLLFRFRNVFISDGQQHKVIELNTKAYSGLYKQYLLRAETALANGYTEEAYQKMQDLKNFKKLNNRYIVVDSDTKEKEEKLAYGLILEYIQQGEILMDKGKSRQAMENYSIALGLQEDFLSYHIDRLDELINKTALPVLLKNIEEAELKIWANKMEEAGILYNRILKDIAFYHLERNSEVKTKVDELGKKLENRKCVDAKYSLSNYMQVVQNRIRSGKWNEAAIAMKKAEAIILNNKPCKLDTVEYIHLKSLYGEAVYYSGKYAETINRLYAYGYASVWKELAGLELYYQRHRLSGLGVPAPQLYQLVKSQQNAGNTKKLTEYFLSKGDGFAAFRYLMLLKNSDLPKRELKELQVKVGVSLASQVSAEQLDHLTENDAKWLQPLIEAYRSSIQ